MASPIGFEQWAVVEVMGHSVFAGKVTEQVVGGSTFIRVDVPAVDGAPEFYKLLGASSIFAITPCSEERARLAAQRIFASPLPVWIPTPTPALPSPAEVPDLSDYEFVEEPSMSAGEADLTTSEFDAAPADLTPIPAAAPAGFDDDDLPF